jgi:tricorn protease
LALLVVTADAAWVMAKPAYVRFPDIHEDRIVFCAEDDLWVTSDAGGSSRRLTTHPGTEYFPQFSPDGRQIAFTGQYDGNRDVFVIPADGGEPRRLTWHPARDEVIGWTPDGRRILFRSAREQPHGSSELFSVPAAGGEIVGEGDLEALPRRDGARHLGGAPRPGRLRAGDRLRR